MVYRDISMNNMIEHIHEYEADGMRIMIAPMKTKDVVRVEGSVLGGPNFFAHRNEMLPILAAELLDAGTRKRSKHALRDALAERGIDLAFGASGDRLTFTGRGFPEDLSFLLTLIAECLSDAAIPDAELALSKIHVLGALAEEKSDTDTLARIALSRMLFDSSHLNYEETLEAQEKFVRAIRRADVVALGKRLGTHGLLLAISGDIDPETAQQIAVKALRKLPKHGMPTPAKNKNAKMPSGGAKQIFVDDKTSVDVYLGASVPLTRDDPAFDSLAVVTDMLGGGFAAHLMQTVRERDGLTYRTFARLEGYGDGADGAFTVYASFAPSRYEESVEVLRKELRAFFDSGITEESLARKKEEIAGSYLVSLSTTRGLAHALHALARDGKPLSYLSRYPDIIRAVSLADARAAAGRIPLSRLSLAASGTFPKR